MSDARTPEGRVNVAPERPESRCAYCGRMIGVFNHPDYGLVLMAHRPTEKHVPGDPWCDGGGRHP